ncbi:MAG: hypothetical protein E7129_02760 [Rikenellaceae bacterium]|nr:hypothetical protein [Rikenellaceae bacterium]MBR2443587.1 hypothetical protein [Rikenellaceae bacterium]
MMKKIFTILMAVLVASTVTIYDAEAQSLLFGRDSVRASKHPRSPFRINRIDRGIDTNAFAYKEEWICGVSASYGTLSTDDSDIALIIENLKLGGSVVTVKPYFGYFYRNNLAIGARFGYTHMVGHFDNANVNLGNFINGIEFSTEGIALGYLSNAYSFSIFHRAYVPLDKRGRFGVFGELELEGSYGRSKFSFMYNDEWNRSISDTYKVRFNFNPGIAAYIFPNVCATVSFGLGGLQYNHIKQFDENMEPTGGTRNYSKLRFRLNIAEINIGVTVHLWSKKSEQKLKLQHE